MPAREQGWIVLRCVNRRAHAVDGAWRLERTVREARLARLDETLLAALEHGAHVIPFIAPALGVVTILARTS